MEYIIIDFEWNGSYSPLTRAYFNELIEIGAVKLDSELNTLSTFKHFIRPFHHKKLTGRVKRLTNLTNEDIAVSEGFVEVFNQFVRWVGTEPNCFLSWGKGDLLVLLENLEYYKMLDRKTFIHSFCDAQEFCQKALDLGTAHQPGLSTIAEMLGISCDNMEMHRALDDSIVTARCLKQLWDEERLFALREECNDEFYKKLMFKTVYITDLGNPHVDRAKLKQTCPICSGKLNQSSKANSRGHYVVIEYRCKNCDKKFTGRHTFKLRYEGVTHRCVLKEIVPKTMESPDGETDSTDSQDSDT